MATLKRPSIANVEEAVRNLLKTLNLDINDEHLRDTPKRIAKMFVNELFRGLYEEPPKVTTFEDELSATNVVIVDGITVKSVCSHHFVPFYGKAIVVYAPTPQRVVGLSKFSRIVDYFARRPQVQERLTKDIVDFIYNTANPWFVVVGMKCRHLCLHCRGANDSAVMETVCSACDQQYAATNAGYIKLVHEKLASLDISL